MSNESTAERKWNQGGNAPDGIPGQADDMFQLLFERCTDPIWLLDPATRQFVDCNEAAARLMGCETKEGLLRMRPEDLSPPTQPDGRNSAEAALEISSRIEAQGRCTFEWMARRADGKDIPLEVTSTQIQTGGRTIQVVISRDVSARKFAETLLRESEERWRTVFEQSPLSIQLFSPDGVSRRVNRAWERLFGMPPEAVEGFNILQNEQLRENGALEFIRRAFAGEVVKVPPRPFELRTSPGQPSLGVKWIGATLFPLRDAAGAIREVVCVHEDTTEQVLAEEEIRKLNATLEKRIEERTAELRQSEARLRTLVEHAPEAIVVFDGETGRFETVNENAVHLYGLPAEQLIQRHPAEVSPEFQPDGRPSFEAAREWIQRAIQGGTPVFEWMHRHASGRLVPCEVRLVRLPAEGRVLIRGSVSDNSERRRRELVQQATYQISEAAHTADDLEQLYGLIHEIIKTLMPAENFYLLLHDAANDRHFHAYHRDETDPVPPPRKISGGLNGYVLSKQRPLRVTREQMLDDSHPWRTKGGTPSAVWLGVPLTVGGKTIGVMAVQDYHNAAAYGEEEERLLTFVAAQTALAIERKRVQQEALERAEQAQRFRGALLELALLDKADLDRTLRAVCEQSASSMDVERVGYWSLDSAGEVLRCETMFRRQLGGLDAQLAGAHVSRGDYPEYFAALATKRPIVAGDAPNHPQTRELADGYLRPLDIGAMLDVPVWLHGRLVGVLCHEHVGGSRRWSSEEVDFAASMANMISISLEAVQRARSEAALRQSEECFRRLFEASSTGVMLHDEHQFLDVNPAIVRMLGYQNAAQLIGKSPMDTAPPFQPAGIPTAELAQRHIRRCLDEGSARFDWVALRADGSEIQMEVILTRIELNGRNFIQAIVNDISERKRAEAELQRALAHERELSQLKSNFVSMVSHEFRTPLGIIMSSAEILKDYLDTLEPDERREHLASIARNSKRMSELMEEVLVLGRLDAGKMQFDPAPLDFGALCGRLADEVRSATDDLCPIQLRTENLDGEAHADERLLRHVLVNLLVNAVKYSEPGTPVEFVVRRESADAVCEIRDRGIGIPENDQAMLFQAFQRGGNVGQRQGTGLGLVIVKRCAELHGGTLDLRSAVGQGTTVTVRIPVFKQP